MLVVGGNKCGQCSREHKLSDNEFEPGNPPRYAHNCSLLVSVLHQEVGGTNSRQEMCLGKFNLTSQSPLVGSAKTSKLAVNCRWREQSSREMIDNPSWHAEIKKIDSSSFLIDKLVLEVFSSGTFRPPSFCTLGLALQERGLSSYNIYLVLRLSQWMQYSIV